MWIRVELVFEFFGLRLIVHAEFEFSFFGAEHHRLPFHAPHHVERCPRLPAQRHLQEVFLNAGFDGLPQFGGDFKVAVRRAKPVDPLMRLFVVIVFDPILDALPGRFKAVELRSHEEVLPDGRPEAFHLAKGHRMLGPGFDVNDVVLF